MAPNSFLLFYFSSMSTCQHSVLPTVVGSCTFHFFFLLNHKECDAKFISRLLFSFLCSTTQTIYFTLPVLGHLCAEEWLPVDLIKRHWPVELPSDDDACLGQRHSPMWLANKRSYRDRITAKLSAMATECSLWKDMDAPQDEKSSASSGDIQKKIVHVETLLPAFHEQQCYRQWQEDFRLGALSRHRHLVLVTSLLEKAPNLGGRSDIVFEGGYFVCRKWQVWMVLVFVH